VQSDETDAPVVSDLTLLLDCAWGGAVCLSALGARCCPIASCRRRRRARLHSAVTLVDAHASRCAIAVCPCASPRMTKGKRKSTVAAAAKPERWQVNAIKNWRCSKSEHAAAVLFNTSMRPDLFKLRWESEETGRLEDSWVPVSNIDGGYASSLVQNYIRELKKQEAAALPADTKKSAAKRKSSGKAAAAGRKRVKTASPAPVETQAEALMPAPSSSIDGRAAAASSPLEQQPVAQPRLTRSSSAIKQELPAGAAAAVQSAVSQAAAAVAAADVPALLARSISAVQQPLAAAPSVATPVREPVKPVRTFTLARKSSSNVGAAASASPITRSPSEEIAETDLDADASVACILHLLDRVSKRKDLSLEQTTFFNTLHEMASAGPLARTHSAATVLLDA
jgi:hypothetical protein